MEQKYNPSRYGLTFQGLICERYGIRLSETAAKQFQANYDENLASEIQPLIDDIDKIVGARPVQLLTFSPEHTDIKETTSPHNFLLANGKTLSLRTTSSGMIAPRTVGQAGFTVINAYFADIFGVEMRDQIQIREQATKLSLYKLSEIADYSFNRDEFTFTRNLGKWTESTTLKYHGVSIAELQTHKNRSFKFRFSVKAIPEWFRLVKETTETLGMTAEAVVCDLFGLEKPDNFKTRISSADYKKIVPIIRDAFCLMPKAVRHTGSEKGERGEASKCSYDFELEGGDKLSLKTNTGNRVCPPEVGQPGAKTCLLYFKDYLLDGIDSVTADIFKEMVLSKVNQLLPVYLSHLFDSDWLLWIYRSGKDFKFEVIHKNEINSDFEWRQEKISFTKPTIEEWNESNTVKYDGLTIGEFQVHKHRGCFKFRFHMPNTLQLLRKR